MWVSDCGCFTVVDTTLPVGDGSAAMDAIVMLGGYFAVMDTSARCSNGQNSSGAGQDFVCYCVRYLGDSDALIMTPAAQ